MPAPHPVAAVNVAPVRSPRLALAEAHPSRLSRAQEQELVIRYAETRSPVLKAKIVEAFMPLTRALAVRYRGGSEPLDDLIQVANLGLIKAIEGFDPAHEKPFRAYATPTILGELRRYFRDHVWTLRLPRGLHDIAMRIDGAVDELTRTLGRPPSPAQIAGHLGITVESVLETLSATGARNTLSLDAPRSQEDENEPMGASVPSIEPGYDRVESQDAAARTVLDHRERLALRMRFEEGKTQTEIGEALGVSQMQISRISRGALWKLLVSVQGEEPASGPVPPIAKRRGAGAACEALERAS